jgi:hypothetical protein
MCASPCRHSIGWRMSDDALRATASMASFLSRPTTIPLAPTLLAALLATMPVPQAKSSTRSPSLPQGCKLDEILGTRCKEERYEVALVRLSTTFLKLPLVQLFLLVHQRFPSFCLLNLDSSCPRCPVVFSSFTFKAP